MGEVLNFRRKKLTGFIPENLEVLPELVPFVRNLREPIIDDRPHGDTNPDSGDCA